MYRFRISHIALCLGALGAGILAGKEFIQRYGSYIDGTNTLPEDFFTGFTDGYFITLVPMLLLLTLSVTVYATPVALTALAAQCTQDTFFILSAWQYMNGSGADSLLPCIFFILSRGFFTYSYLLLCLRTLHYRYRTRLLPSTLGTVLRPGSRAFFKEYMSIAGLCCLSGLFTHTVLYFS